MITYKSSLDAIKTIPLCLTYIMSAGDTRRNQLAIFFDPKEKKKTVVLLQEKEDLHGLC